VDAQTVPFAMLVLAVPRIVLLQLVMRIVRRFGRVG
jgi:hypothetical protein